MIDDNSVTQSNKRTEHPFGVSDRVEPIVWNITKFLARTDGLFRVLPTHCNNTKAINKKKQILKHIFEIKLI